MKHIMKTFAVLMLALVVLTTGCSKPVQNYRSSVSISLLDVENGKAYYTAHVSGSFNWNSASFTDQCKLVDVALEKCSTDAKTQGATSFSVVGNMSDGRMAFTWSGGTTVKMKTYSSALGTQEFTYTLSKLP